jgi:hypothetical protein
VSRGLSRIDRFARWLAKRACGASPPVATGALPTRGDLLGTASIAAAALLAPRLLRPTVASAMPTSCVGDCNRQADAAYDAGDVACREKAKEITKRYNLFFLDETFVDHYHFICAEAVAMKVLAGEAKCIAACASGRTSARIAQPKGPPVAPPPPPPPPRCPDNTFFCTVGAGGGDVCCLNGYTCCSCGICCVPAVKCACCGG